MTTYKLLKLLILTLAFAGGASAQVVIPASSSGGITSVASLPATCTPGVTAPVVLSVAPFAIYTCTAPNTWSSSADVNRGISCGACKADAQASFTATITNGSFNVTTSGGDIAFTSADTGKTNFGTAGGGAVLAHIAGKLAMAEGTFTFVSAHAGTSSTAGNANATGVASNYFIWGTNDSASLTAAYATANIAGALCTTFLLPGHAFLVDTNWGTGTAPVCGDIISSSSREGMSFQGFGLQSTMMIVAPNFDPTTCAASGCFMVAPGGSLNNFSIWGGERGDCPSTFNGKSLLSSSNDENISYVLGLGWCAGNSNTSVGLNNTFGSAMQRISFDGFGNSTLAIGGLALITSSFFGDTTSGVSCNSGMVSTNNVYADVAVSFIEFLAGTNCILRSVNDTWLSLGGGNPIFGLKVIAGTSYLVNDTIDVSNGTTALAAWANGGNLNAINSSFKSGATQPGGDVLVNNSSTYNDLGGNTYASQNLNLNDSTAKLIADGMTLTGACTGTVTAASTLGLYGTGPNEVITTCTSVIIGSGVVMTSPRKLTNLFVTNVTGGVNASSGVVTVLKNGAGTALTCTIGTVTTGCQDNLTAHGVTVVAGDLISIQFTTQAVDTLAGVKAVVKWN